METEKNAGTYEQLVKAARKKYLSHITGEITIQGIIDRTSLRKQEYDKIEKILDSFKKFFKEIGKAGEHFEGDIGYIDLMGRAASTVEPEKLKKLLVSLDREGEFLDMVTVKVADVRTKLGTVLFDKIAKTVPNASITVKIGTKK